MREKILELVIKLCGQRFVVSHDQRGTVHCLDHLCHGVGLAGAGDAEQHLMLLAIVDAAEEGFYGATLIALRFVIGNEFEIH